MAKGLRRMAGIPAALPASTGRGNARAFSLLWLSAVALSGTCTSATLAASRDLCPTRPGLNTPSCTVDPGRVLLEIGLADWTLDRAAGSRHDSIAVGETLLRYGIDDRTEAEFGWTAYGHDRVRRRSGVEVKDGVGDVMFAIKRGLGAANGPLALQAHLSAPTGGAAIGAGGWEAGMMMPVSLPLPGGLGFALTPGIDWLADENGGGHHIAYGSAIGVSRTFAKAITVAVEGQVTRDDDPGKLQTSIVGSGSLAWQTDDDSQIDIGVVTGLSDAPDLQLYLGISRRF